MLQSISPFSFVDSRSNGAITNYSETNATYSSRSLIICFLQLFLKKASIILQLYFILMPVSIIIPLNVTANILFLCTVDFLMELCYFLIKIRPFL